MIYSLSKPGLTSQIRRKKKLLYYVLVFIMKLYDPNSHLHPILPLVELTESSPVRKDPVLC